MILLTGICREGGRRTSSRYHKTFEQPETEEHAKHKKLNLRVYCTMYMLVASGEISRKSHACLPFKGRKKIGCAADTVPLPPSHDFIGGNVSVDALSA
jgi:hypothetical protein